MSVLVEMQGIVRGAAAPGVPGESVKAAIGRAARRLRLDFARARSHWYGLARMVPAEEADRLRALQRELVLDRLAALDREQAALRSWVATMRGQNDPRDGKAPAEHTLAGQAAVAVAGTAGDAAGGAAAAAGPGPAEAGDGERG